MLQATTAPAAPTAPTAPGAPTVVSTGTALAPISSVPTTIADVQALRAKRSELSNQLESAAGRRARLSSQLVGKEGADRAGIEARIGVLDKRIMQLESDIAETGRQLTMAPNALVASSESLRGPANMDPDAIAAISITFILVVLGPMAFAMTRRIWKRTNTAPRPAALSDDATKRLERLEQGMDAIAIEIERVSEGQRFVTKLLSEAHNSPMLPSSQREATPVGGQERR
ncbi:MAG TPA: hypothetical protein VM099_07715 [Gemmatimonadaceae bacterium]|nr:hypothetical protein [Gemmatimonadaceae bacterium]